MDKVDHTFHSCSLMALASSLLILLLGSILDFLLSISIASLSLFGYPYGYWLLLSVQLQTLILCFFLLGASLSWTRSASVAKVGSSIAPFLRPLGIWVLLVASADAMPLAPTCRLGSTAYESSSA